jgi:hypothetical protein
MKATRWSKRKRERERRGKREIKASTEKRLAPSLSNDYPG